LQAGADFRELATNRRLSPMRFSERSGIKPIKNVIQTEGMDDDLRNGLWNALDLFYWEHVVTRYGYNYHESDELISKLCRSVWLNYFKQPLDTLPSDWGPTYQLLRKYFFACQWYEAYDFLEFVPSNYLAPYRDENPNFRDYCNRILERELSAYRFVGDKLTQITSKTEIAEIEQAMTSADPLRSVSLHIKTALGLLADRKSPDYRNCIKESISAVEAACKLITNDEKATLGEAIKKFKSKVGLHAALEKAFLNMYGYTNDADGIRHALMEESTLTFEDAKFMLVSCSAFVNYLTAKSARQSRK
jgi:hypothetical protein